MYLSGPQPDNPTHEEIAPIIPMRRIHDVPLREMPRLPTSKLGIRKIPASTIEKPSPDEARRNQPTWVVPVTIVNVEDCDKTFVKLIAFSGNVSHT
jgi:hypothetical protein